jgi:hypothetical protein
MIKNGGKNAMEKYNPDMKKFCSGIVFLFLSMISWFYLIPYRMPLPASLQRAGILGMNSRNPRIFPQMTVAFIFCLSVMQLIAFFREVSQKKALAIREGVKPFDLMSSLKAYPQHLLSEEYLVVFTIVLFVIYAIMMPKIGFIVTTFLLAFVINWMLGSRGFFLGVLAPIILILLVYFMFVSLLNVRFPDGILF